MMTNGINNNPLPVAAPLEISSSQNKKTLAEILNCSIQPREGVEQLLVDVHNLVLSYFSPEELQYLAWTPSLPDSTQTPLSCALSGRNVREMALDHLTAYPHRNYHLFLIKKHDNTEMMVDGQEGFKYLRQLAQSRNFFVNPDVMRRPFYKVWFDALRTAFTGYNPYEGVIRAWTLYRISGPSACHPIFSYLEPVISYRGMRTDFSYGLHTQIQVQILANLCRYDDEGDNNLLSAQNARWGLLGTRTATGTIADIEFFHMARLYLHEEPKYQSEIVEKLRARLAPKLNNSESTRAYLEAAEKELGNHAFVQEYLGDFFSSIKGPANYKDLPKAISYYKKSIQLEPHRIASHLGLANVFISLKDWQAAEEPLKCVIELDPNNELARDNLRLVLCKIYS